MPLRPGYKTSEFALALVVVLGTALDALAGSLPDRYGALAAALAAGLYAVGRGLAKVRTPVVPAAQPTTVVPPQA
jgi:hypothetical protein